MINNYFEKTERNCELIWSGNYYEFHTTLDLGDKVILIPINPHHITESQRLSDVASFLSYWFTNIYKHLNGYQGIDCVQWEVQTENPKWIHCDPHHCIHSKICIEKSHMRYKCKVNEGRLVTSEDVCISQPEFK